MQKRFKYENLLNYIKCVIWTRVDMSIGRRRRLYIDSLGWRLNIEGEREWKKERKPWVGSTGAKCCKKEKGDHGRKGGPGTHRGRGTLTPAGSPLPFPYTGAPASSGPAPASVWRAADTRQSTGLAQRTMDFSHHHHRPKLPSHGYSHTGVFSLCL